MKTDTFRVVLIGYDGFKKVLKNRIERGIEVIHLDPTSKRVFIYNKQRKATRYFVETDEDGAKSFQQHRAMVAMWTKVKEESLIIGTKIMKWCKQNKDNTEGTAVHWGKII